MISVIVCSITPQKLAAVKAMYAAALANEKWELIGIHDARSMAAGYTRGIAQSKGDIMVFSHDDVEVLSPSFGPTLRRHLNSFDLIGVAGSTLVTNGYWSEAGPPFTYVQIVYPLPEGKFQVDIFSNASRVVGGIQAVDGVFIAARRSIFSRIGFDAKTFDGFHLFDHDLCFAARAAGFKIGVACDICLLHMSPGTFDSVLGQYAARFANKWMPGQASAPARKFVWTSVTVRSKAEALEVMKPPHWGP